MGTDQAQGGGCHFCEGWEISQGDRHSRGGHTSPCTLGQQLGTSRWPFRALALEPISSRLLCWRGGGGGIIRECPGPRPPSPRTPADQPWGCSSHAPSVLVTPQRGFSGLTLVLKRPVRRPRGTQRARHGRAASVRKESEQTDPPASLPGASGGGRAHSAVVPSAPVSVRGPGPCPRLCSRLSRLSAHAETASAPRSCPCSPISASAVPMRVCLGLCFVCVFSSSAVAMAAAPQDARSPVVSTPHVVPTRWCRLFRLSHLLLLLLFF